MEDLEKKKKKVFTILFLRHQKSPPKLKGENFILFLFIDFQEAMYIQGDPKIAEYVNWSILKINPALKVSKVV